MLELRAEPILSARAKERQLSTLKQNTTDKQNSAERQEGQTRDTIAKRAGVSHDTVDKVKKIVTEGTDEQKRRNLDSIDEGNKLLRRKELYEMIHPETKAGTAGANATNQKRWGIATEEFSAATEKSFVDDTAEKMGITPRSVRNLIQTARDLTPETKEVVKQNKIGVKQSLYLSQIKDPSQQLSAAQKLAAHEIKSVEERLNHVCTYT